MQLLMYISRISTIILYFILDEGRVEVIGYAYTWEAFTLYVHSMCIFLCVWIFYGYVHMGVVGGVVCSTPLNMYAEHPFDNLVKRVTVFVYVQCAYMYIIYNELSICVWCDSNWRTWFVGWMDGLTGNKVDVLGKNLSLFLYRYSWTRVSRGAMLNMDIYGGTVGFV